NEFNAKAGATAIGARKLLIAYNVNLNTKSVRRANSVAFDVREQGRVKTLDGTPAGNPMVDEKGDPIRVPGMLKHVKAIGWYVEEYGIAQVSMNLTNIKETPLHAAFDACHESATKRGLRVTGSEIVGMTPKKCLVDAGRHFLQKQNWSEGAAEEELIDIAIRTMGLSELKPFHPKEKLHYISDWAVKAQGLKDEMLSLVDEDTVAFNKVMAAFGLPKGTAKEKSARSAAIEAANKLAAEVPLRVMQTAAKAYDLLAEMAARGNPASISDVGVGLLAVRACIEGAGMNVRFNVKNLKDEKSKTSLSNKVHVFVEESEARFKEISKLVEKKLKG